MKQLPGGRRSSNDLNNQELMAFHVSTLKRDIFSNLAGGAWVAALTLIITPSQINLLGVEVFGLIVKWGIEGAAVAWLLLNAGYVVVIVSMVRRSILIIPVMPWLMGIFLPFATLGVVTCGSAKLIANYFSLSVGCEMAIILPPAVAYMGLGYFF